MGMIKSHQSHAFPPDAAAAAFLPSAPAPHPSLRPANHSAAIILPDCLTPFPTASEEAAVAISYKHYLAEYLSNDHVSATHKSCPRLRHPLPTLKHYQHHTRVCLINTAAQEGGSCCRFATEMSAGTRHRSSDSFLRSSFPASSTPIPFLPAQ